MPTVTAKEFHCTLTASFGVSLNLQDRIVAYADKHCEAYFIVLEHGSGGNPHIHAYLCFNKDKRGDTLKKSLITKVYQEVTVPKRAIAIKRVDDVRALTGGYMVKESTHEVLGIKNVDIEENKEYAKKFYATKKVKQKGLSLCSAHHTINKYANENEMIITNWTQFKEVFCKMVADGYNMLMITGKAYNVFSHYMAVYADDSKFLMDRLEGSRTQTLNKEQVASF